MDFSFGFGLGSSAYLLSGYNPLINYDWSTTTTSGLRYLKDVGSTPTYNASMYFGRGAYFNGVDQGIYAGTANLTTDSYSIVITTVNRYSSWYSTAIQADNGASVIGFTNTQQARFRVLTTEILSSSSIPINTPTTLIGVVTNNIGKLYVNGILDSSAVAVSKASWNNLYIGQRSGNTDYYKGTCKDMFIFSRALTQAEITQAYEQPEAFYAMAQADNTCVLNMPMCETSSTVRNYKTGIDYPISNYTSSARDNAKNLQYGLQTCKFVRDSLGIIQSASNYLEGNGTGYANTGWSVDTTKDFTVEFTKYVDHRNDASDWLIQESGLYSKLRVSTSKYSGGWLQVMVDNNLTSTSISNIQGTFVSIVVVAVAGSNFKVYVNKVLKSTTAFVNTVVDTQGFRLGSGLTWNTNGEPRNFEKNPIAKFKVHNKALTNEEIQAL